MSRKIANILYKEIEGALTSKEFLKKIGLTKKNLASKLKEFNWKNNILSLVSMEEIRCVDVFEFSRSMMESMADKPEPNWLNFIHEYLITDLYPEKETFISAVEKEKYTQSVLLFLEVLRCVLKFEGKRNPVPENKDLKFIKNDLIANNRNVEEYRRLQKISGKLYIYELLKLSREIMPFDLFSHISGVHYIAVHCAIQLAKIGVPVDLSLVSGAAITHDIGKFGCNKKEVARIPYLHYYYTDKFCKRSHLNHISHIASNHSTWDLELENLSAESLLLIYADFRVKSTRVDEREVVNFYSLEEAFEVILSKLDDVDEDKEQRYRKVYAKLKDFEDYMTQLGINVDLNSSKIDKNKMKDVNLLNGDEVIDRIKFMAVDHNIKVMNQFNDEAAFASLLELARSERHWQNLRGQLNILKEYYTYMTKKQKQMTLRFMYDLLGYREGDIRREAAQIMGNLIVTFDEKYRKELPEGVKQHSDAINSFSIWKEYLEKIIVMDYKVADQQKRWIGYTLKTIISAILKKANEEEQKKYVKYFVEYLNIEKYDDITIFVLLETLFYIPMELCEGEIRNKIIRFVDKASEKESLEINIAVSKITRGKKGKNTPKGPNSELFRENLKVNTPWIVKSQNIEVLMERLAQGNETSALQIATHFSNLLKVCEKVTVRHKAGRTLLKVAPELTLDQRNELAIELTKGLEIGEYEYSKYIPEYLGQLAIMLHPYELDELLNQIKKLTESTNIKVASVALDTLGQLLRVYPKYGELFDETDKKRCDRKSRIIGMILKGLANYDETISQEAFIVIGQYIFGDAEIDEVVKFDYFKLIYKKMTILLSGEYEEILSFYNHAANLNHIYRFVSDYMLKIGNMNLHVNEKFAFFPGTFDPFSLSHKEIVKTIRDMGYEVYLAVDEFSWSKKTQPHMIRRKIASMSVADEQNIYIYPDDIPINIANPDSIKTLKESLSCKELYIVVGSDVIKNASSYEKKPKEDSIHSMNHIVFKRVSGQGADLKEDEIEEERLKLINGNVVKLSLPTQFEDVSSTRIRENVDINRDISSFVDPLVQNYIHEKNLYIREPQYKGMVELESLRVGNFRRRRDDFIKYVKGLHYSYDKKDIKKLEEYSNDKHVKSIVIRDSKSGNNVVAIASAKEMSTSNLYEEFKDFEITKYIRDKVRGKVLVIGDIFIEENIASHNVCQLLITELLANALKEDFNYAIYNPMIIDENEEVVKKVLKLQGFKSININGVDKKTLSVDMRNPVVIIQNTETMLKEPFDKNAEVETVLNKTHERIQKALTNLYPNNLILSVNAGVMQNKLIKLIRDENRIENTDKTSKGKRKLGDNMCVPFGEIMKTTVIPNTVTKTVHMEKVFAPGLASYDIQESQNYAKLRDQIKTIKAFNRPVILLDDLLNRGYRLKELNTLLAEEMVEVKSVVVGILSANGQDLASMGGRKTVSGYFLPNMQAWFNESGQYPFIGGDAVMNREDEGSSSNTAVNLILPYAAPVFLKNRSKTAMYEFSMTCLENARDILMVIEKVYQEKFEKKLTVGRLSEVFIKVCIPDMDGGKSFNEKMSPSDYVKLDIERLLRLKGLMD